MKKHYHRLRLLLGDQLNIRHPWFSETREDTLYLLMEVRQETDYALHHIQKVVAFFRAMRSFADELEAAGHQVYYLPLNDPDNRQDIPENLDWLIDRFGIREFACQEPDEYRLDQQLSGYVEKLSIPAGMEGTAHFLTGRYEVRDFFAGKKQFLMESFYREMRRKHRILMTEDGHSPLGGQWNFDKENRKRWPDEQELPGWPGPGHDVSGLVEMIRDAGLRTIGRIDPLDFRWPVTRNESRRWLEEFLKNRLPYFGTYQDALSGRDPFLFHSRLSFSLNVKLLHPLEVVEAVTDYWERNQDTITINQVEGFIRQLIGWREYMRGLYWAHMPGFSNMNFFGHRAPLPEFFWSGETDMECLRVAIGQSLDHAYAHHIQRLMVTGAFALLGGVDPDAVDEWYLGIYADAVEWVQLPNTRGMSQFADGGLVGTKPYVGSANYINKMGDHCKGCRYDPSIRTGPDSCPFNSLYWDFYHRHRDKLARNPRIGMMYRILDKMDTDELEALLERAAELKTRFFGE